MKKITKLTIAVLCTLAIAIVMVGCVRKSEITDRKRDNTVPEKKVVADNNAQHGNTVAQNPTITEERAKEIVLERAGLTADEVIFDRIELDRDNGREYYEVEFRQGRTEYSADVDATDGTIYDWDVDYDD